MTTMPTAKALSPWISARIRPGEPAPLPDLDPAAGAARWSVAGSAVTWEAPTFRVRVAVFGQGNPIYDTRWDPTLAFPVPPRQPAQGAWSAPCRPQERAISAAVLRPCCEGGSAALAICRPCGSGARPGDSKRRQGGCRGAATGGSAATPTARSAGGTRCT